MSTFIRKSHNVSVVMYHVVFGSKYRRTVFNADVETVFKEVCLDIALRYEIRFLEIGADGNYVDFLIQSVPVYSPSVPMYSPTQIVRTIKSITAKKSFWEIFRRVPSVKTQLWVGAFWSSGFYIDTVGRHDSEETIRRYIAAFTTNGTVLKPVI